METIVPTGVAALEWTTKSATAVPTNPTSETFRLDIYRNNVRHRACQLSRGSTDTRVASTAHHYAIAGLPFTAAAIAAGSILPAGTIPEDTWGIYLVSEDNAGAKTLTAGAANFTTGYADEATAIAALPSTPADQYAVGFFTVLTNADEPFVGGTDALAGGASGNPAATTNYYTLAERLASASPAGRGALSYAAGGIATGSHEMFVDAALAGAGASVTSFDKVIVRYLTGTVGVPSIIGDLVGKFGVAIDGLSTAVSAAVEAAVEEGLADFGAISLADLDITDMTVAAGSSATVLNVSTSAGGTRIRKGFARIRSGDRIDESLLVSWAGTVMTVLSQTDMPTALKQFSGAPADGDLLRFTPL